MIGEVCGDNRFEIIMNAKKILLETTNIETSPEEMAVLDAILFRMWQRGWLPGCKRWIKTSERVPELEKDVLLFSKQSCSVGFLYVRYDGQIEWVIDREMACCAVEYFPYWMPLPELPEEVEE